MSSTNAHTAIKVTAEADYLDKLTRLGRPAGDAGWQIWFDNALWLLRLRHAEESEATDAALFRDLGASATIKEACQHLRDGTEFTEHMNVEGLNQVLTWMRELIPLCSVDAGFPLRATANVNCDDAGNTDSRPATDDAGTAEGSCQAADR